MSLTPIADTRHPAFTPIFCRRDGGCRILSAHFSAASPRSNDATPPGNVTLSVPLRATTFDICANGIDSFRSPPRNCRMPVSRRAFPGAALPLNRAVTVASLPISVLLFDAIAGASPFSTPV